jgi:GTP:adenosylcobinamide-phosphate guanylyltransferase
MNTSRTEVPNGDTRAGILLPGEGGTRSIASPDAVVVCGGFGTRMGQAMRSAKCKSLISILGMPCLAYVLEALKRVNCQKCILSVDRQEIFNEIERIGNNSGLNCVMHTDSGRGPTAVAQETSSLVTSPRFIVLYGHQIVFPDHLVQMIAANRDFVATVYRDSSEGVRNVATIDSEHNCVKLRRGSQEYPAIGNDVYLDKPYILETQSIRNSCLPDNTFDPNTPADLDLRQHTILRYARSLYSIPATFRHEFHYEMELDDVEAIARRFKQESYG